MSLSTVQYCGYDTRFSEPQDASKKRIVLDTESQLHYGVYYTPSATDNLLRSKCLQLFLTNVTLVFPLIRVGYRAGALLTGNWAKNGYNKAKFEWDRQRFTALSEGREKEIEQTLSLVGRVAFEVTWQLAKDITKLATYPIAWAATTLIAITVGMAAPLHARLYISNIERLWSIDISSKKLSVEAPQTTKTIIGLSHTQHCNYLAVCFQPKEVWEKENLFQLYPDYLPTTMRSRLHLFQGLFQKYHFYFEKVNMDGQVRIIKQAIKDTGLSDPVESKLRRTSTIFDRLFNKPSVKKINDHLDNLHRHMVAVILAGEKYASDPVQHKAEFERAFAPFKKFQQG